MDLDYLGCVGEGGGGAGRCGVCKGRGGWMWTVQGKEGEWGAVADVVWHREVAGVTT